MPDDQATTTAETTETTATTETAAAAEVTAPTETTTTAPSETEQRLDRIVAQRLGKYAARTERAEAEAAELRERLARLEGRVEAAKPAAPAAQKVWTETELQALVDQSRITPAQMAAQIAMQVAASTKREVLTEIDQRQRTQTALHEVNDYRTKIPALANTASPEFQRVASAAWDIAEETGMDVRDPRVQRRALRETFGTLDRIAAAATTREFSRAHAETHTETGGGGGHRAATPDPLKDVEPERIEYWKAHGYTRERMIEEAKYIRRPLRRRA